MNVLNVRHLDFFMIYWRIKALKYNIYKKKSIKLYIDCIFAWLLFTGFHFWHSNDMHILFHVQKTYIDMFSDSRFRIRYYLSILIYFRRS